MLLVCPAQHVRSTLTTLGPRMASGQPVVVCAKGLEQATGKLLVEVLAESAPRRHAGGAVGAELRRRRRARAAGGADAGDAGRSTRPRVSPRRLGYRHFRLYWADDLVGTQLGGAVKNVLAIAAGIVDGRQLGASAHAALVTRGFAELRRFGEALGARADTLMGLSGLGDLLLTCGSPQSRNMSLGRALGQGQSLADVLGSRRSVAEGVYTAAAVVKRAREKGIEMPIAEAVHAIVEGKLSVDAAIEALLSRPFKAEG